ncbi:MAG: type II CAAX endopeptidase family protein [Candidatus Acidiferrum sp.]
MPEQGMNGDPFGLAPRGHPETDASTSDSSWKVYPNQTGLGAGWRLLIYLAISFILWSLSIFLLSELIRPGRSVFSPSFQLYGEAASFLAVFLAACIMSLLEEVPVGVYGLPVRDIFGKFFIQGCLFGLCEICLLIGLIAMFGGYSLGSMAEHGAAIGKWALYWGFFFLVVGLFEEFLFRGYTLYTLADGIGFWPAAALMSGAFGAIHLRNPGEGWVGVAGVAFVGLFWCFTLKRTGNLWFALGMHATFDFGETFLFSVPDSGMIFPGHLSNATLHGPKWLTGGTAGPEGSLFDFLILAGFFVAVHFLYPAGGQRPKSGEAAG